MARVLIGDPVALLLPNALFLLVALAVVLWLLRGRTQRTLRLAVGAALLWSYAASTPGLANKLLWSLETRHPVVPLEEVAPQPGAVVLVLASGYGKVTAKGPEIRLGEAGWERVTAGVMLWRRVGGRLIFSGQPVASFGGSVAGVMAAQARELGVPSEAIVVEGESRNTRENLLFAGRWVGKEATGVWIVTSASHLPRAMAVARALDMNAKGFPCDFRAIRYGTWGAWLPHVEAPGKLKLALREYLALGYYRWQGWI